MGRGVKLTTPPNTFSWRDAQLKHRDNFTFNFTTNFAFPFSYFKLITGLLDKYVGLVVDFSVMPQLIYIVHISSYLNVKSNVTVLLFKWAPRHEGVFEKWRYSSTYYFTSALGGGEWLASRPGFFTPMERVPGTHSIGGWVGSQSRSGRSGDPFTYFISRYANINRHLINKC